MAEITGENGSVALASLYDTNVHGWSLNIAAEELETTACDGTAAARTYLPGIYNWSGSFTAWLDDTTALDLPGQTAESLTLSATGSRTYSGNAIITSSDVNCQVGEMVEVTCNFRGTGALTIA